MSQAVRHNQRHVFASGRYTDDSRFVIEMVGESRGYRRFTLPRGRNYARENLFTYERQAK